MAVTAWQVRRQASPNGLSGGWATGSAASLGYKPHLYDDAGQECMCAAGAEPEPLTILIKGDRIVPNLVAIDQAVLCHEREQLFQRVAVHRIHNKPWGGKSKVYARYDIHRTPPPRT